MSLLRRARPFRFRTRLDAQTVADRIAELHTRQPGLLSSRRSILAEVEPRPSGEASFYLHRDGGQNLIATVSGHIYPDDTGAIVRGTGAVGGFTAGFLVLFGVIWTSILGFVLSLEIDSHEPLFMLIFGWVFLGVIWNASVQNREHLIEAIEEQLQW